MTSKQKCCTECGAYFNGLYDTVCDHCAALEDEWAAVVIRITK